ncbi:hypothetical protein Tco_0511825 [Tanacetum coccineum]
MIRRPPAKWSHHHILKKKVCRKRKIDSDSAATTNIPKKQNEIDTKAAMKCFAITNSIRSGSHTDIGAQDKMRQHIHIDDVAKHLDDELFDHGHC